MAKGPFFRGLGCLAAQRFPAAACPRPARSLAEPLNGPGRQPLSLRVCACEAQPRTPHPTGLGYPAPAKLSLCPTSVTPLEAPLIGQDAIRIRQVLGTGIRNAQKFFRQRLQHRRVGKGALAPCPPSTSDRSKKMVGTLRFAHPTACALPPPKTLPDRDRRSSTDPRRS